MVVEAFLRPQFESLAEILTPIQAATAFQDVSNHFAEDALLYTAEAKAELAALRQEFLRGGADPRHGLRSGRWVEPS